MRYTGIKAAYDVADEAQVRNTLKSANKIRPDDIQLKVFPISRYNSKVACIIVQTEKTSKKQPFRHHYYYDDKNIILNNSWKNKNTISFLKWNRIYLVNLKEKRSDFLLE